MRHNKPSPSSLAPAPLSTVRHALRAVVAVVAVGGALAVAVALMATIGSLNPFGRTHTEASDSVVLAQVHDLARFDAATGRFQTIVDDETGNKVLPSWATGQRVVLNAEGDVTASVDLSHLGPDSIQVSDNGRHVTVHVPAPVLDQPRLDPDTTRVLTRDRGVVDRVGDAVSGSDPTNDQPLYQRASEKLADAAEQSDLRERARTNTERFLRDTLGAAGVTDVTVVFDVASPGQAA